MDEYFKNQQRQIEDMNQKLDSILQMLTNPEPVEDPPLRANETDEVWKVSRATGNKIRKKAIGEGKLNPIKLPSGSVRYLRSEVVALNHKSHTA